MEIGIDEQGKITLARPFDKEIEISSGYGIRTIEGKQQFHRGYDFKTPVGTKVMACADGATFRVGWEDEQNHKQGFGLRIWQEIFVGGKHFYIWYGHLMKSLVNEGDRIKKGQEIAFTGNTGHSIGPHCHIQCRERNTNEFYEIDFI